MNRTTHLNLIQPAPNSTNWGQALNQNFETLDSRFAGLNNQIMALRSQMGQLGLYYNDPQYKEHIFMEVLQQSNQSWIVTRVYIELAASNTQIVLYDNGQLSNLNQLIDYSMFLVKFNNDEVREAKWRDLSWHPDDIAVKLTRYDALERRNIVDIVRMLQSVGGYYRPSEYTLDDNNYPALQYNRINALETTELYAGPALCLVPKSVEHNTVSFEYGQIVPGSGYQTLKEDAGVSITYPQIITKAISHNVSSNSVPRIDTQITISDYLITGVEFTIGGQRVIAEYTVSTLNGKYLVDAHSNNWPADQTITITINYASKRAVD